MEMQSIKGARNDRSYGTGYQYGENYTGTYLIIKNYCEDPDHPDMSDEDVSTITRWLCRKHYKWFRFIDPDNVDDIWYKVYFRVQKDMIGDSVVGLRLTIITNAPYGFSKEINHTYTDRNFEVFTNSDEEGYVYPDLKIKLKEGGDFRLKNVTENRTTALNNCIAGEIITLSGYDTQQITSTNEAHDYIHEFNYKFPRLWNRYAITKNEFECNLNAEIEFTYREVRKVGMK